MIFTLNGSAGVIERYCYEGTGVKICAAVCGGEWKDTEYIISGSGSNSGGDVITPHYGVSPK